MQRLINFIAEDTLNGPLYKGDREKFFEHHPAAKGFLREPARLYQKREQAMELLDEKFKKQIPRLIQTMTFP